MISRNRVRSGYRPAKGRHRRTISHESNPFRQIRRDSRASRPVVCNENRNSGGDKMLILRKPYLLYLGTEVDPRTAKTAFGIRDWAADACIGQFREAADTVDLRLPDLCPSEAAAGGAGSLIVGIAPTGGAIPISWHAALLEAARCGLDIVSGMHFRLGEVPGLREAATQGGGKLIDVRVPPVDIPVASGRRRTGNRLLTVGTDCAQGKKYTALALAAAMRARGEATDFRATGQTGIIISGNGIPMDAVVSDFIAGAAEMLSPDNTSQHWDIIEGQGALHHPAYAAVTLGLIHGSQPDVLVLCHESGRREIAEYPGYPIAPLADVAEAYLAAARLTNPAVRLGAVSLLTAHLSDDECARELHMAKRELGVPAFDPMRTSMRGAITSILTP